MKNILIVVDVQNDFVYGALGTEEAKAIIPNVETTIKDCAKEDYTIIFTRDTHHQSYMDSLEGKNLPVPHCIEGSEGWEIIDEIKPYSLNRLIIDKPSFGSKQLGNVLSEISEGNEIGSIVLIGLCTDICVISNALLIKAFLPEIPVKVISDCCAGVTPESHENALKSMAMCQIEII